MGADKQRRLREVVLPLLSCVACGGPELELREVSQKRFPGSRRTHLLACDACGRCYPVCDAIPIMLDDPTRAFGYPPEVVVEHAYGEHWLELIGNSRPRPVLDLGSGNNPSHEERIVKLDIFPLPNVDVVGVGERLPFRDGAFGLVLSGAVFEHLKDPFRAIGEVERVLGEGGEVYIETAFLQPVHAFPDHYYNMTLQGLERLCAPFARLASGVQPHQYPSFTVRWILDSWSRKLAGEEQQDFLGASVRTILKEYTEDVFSKRWMTGFRPEDLQELACGVYFHGRKDGPGSGA